MSGETRFDCDARCEIWVREEDIRAHPDFAKAVAIADPEKRLYALKTIAVSVAQERINTVTRTIGDFVIITAYPTASNINLDRINWQELAATSHV